MVEQRRNGMNGSRNGSRPNTVTKHLILFHNFILKVDCFLSEHEGRHKKHARGYMLRIVTNRHKLPTVTNSSAVMVLQSLLFLEGAIAGNSCLEMMTVTRRTLR